MSSTVLVTGASSGIGKATARRFAERGARVFGTSRRDHPDLDGVTMLRLDTASAESVRRCVDQVLDRAGHLDVLVNNAGMMHEGFVEETTEADARTVFEVNFFGMTRLVDAVLPGMRSRGRGRIVNVGSLAAVIGEPGEGYYAASKAAMARYTEALRHEVWHLGIHVSRVEPGAFGTGVLRAAATATPAIADYDGPRESASATLHAELAKGGDPAEVAALITRIAAARSPRGCYRVGRRVERLIPYLVTLVPQRLVDSLLRRDYGLPRR